MKSTCFRSFSLFYQSVIVVRPRVPVLDAAAPMKMTMSITTIRTVMKADSFIQSPRDQASLPESLPSLLSSLLPSAGINGGQVLNYKFCVEAYNSRPDPIPSFVRRLFAVSSLIVVPDYSLVNGIQY